MSAPLESEPSLTSSAEMAAAGPAGLGPGERDVVAGRYRLRELIAQGGMGSVYLAEHVLSRKKLAVKVVHPYLCKGRQGVERFRREVSAAAEIDHPGIVQVYDAGVDDDGGFFMAMELLEGESLGDLLRRDWPGMKRAVALVEGMLEPLAKAHAKGFVHRDLKPDNVFIANGEGGERVKILDFGLAREVAKGGPTRTGITFGTPEYMSPEQAISARKVRAPGDVWSVGVMLYELLSGEHPFNGETPNAIMANAIKEAHPPLAERAPHVPEPLARVIERCLEKKAEDRPADAGVLLAELRAVVAELTLADTVPSAPVAPAKWDASEDEPPDSSPFPLEPVRSNRSIDIAVELQETIVPSEVDRRIARSGRLGLVIGAIGLVAVAGAAIGIYFATASDDPSPPRAATRPAEPTREPVEVTEPDAPPDPAEPPSGIEPGAEPSAEAPEPSAEVAEPSAPAQPAQASTRRVPHRPAAAAEPAGPSALDEARDCLGRGDRQCARRILEERARTAAEQALLIDTYRSLGLMPQALDRMERFVRRHPRAPQTAGYREDLRRYGRGP